ncbi:Hypothetical protein D9617_8g049860 [Elsinoe fawcettii]|nr:Hypothetical protein D9617_8g049860 [Elsinoe fawcettii]
MALLDVHRQLWEVPRLRPYMWLASGMTTFRAAVTLTSCLLDQTTVTEFAHYQLALEKAIGRLQILQSKSPAYERPFNALQDLRTHLLGHLEHISSPGDFNGMFDQWIEHLNLPGAGNSEWMLFNDFCQDQAST